MRATIRRIFRNHGLSLVMLGLFFVAFLVGQFLSGIREYNDERGKHGLREVNFPESKEVQTPHWENEE